MNRGLIELVQKCYCCPLKKKYIIMKIRVCFIDARYVGLVKVGYYILSIVFTIRVVTL